MQQFKSKSWEEVAAVAKRMGISTYRWTGRTTVKIKKADLLSVIEAELAESLDTYTNPNDPSYDAEFDREIRELRPDWFSDN